MIAAGGDRHEHPVTSERFEALDALDVQGFRVVGGYSLPQSHGCGLGNAPEVIASRGALGGSDVKVVAGALQNHPGPTAVA